MNKQIEHTKEQTAIEYQIIEIGKIRGREGRRRTGDLTGLMASIERVGLLHPIVVTSNLDLVSGLHRLEACEKLGMKLIPATIRQFEKPDAELAELQENLERNHLTVLERGETLARWKANYETRHPETKHGNTRARAKAKRKNCVLPPTFTEMAAEKLRMSKRTIEQEVRIGQMPKSLRDEIRNSAVGDSKTELNRLASYADDNKAMKVAAKIKSGAANSLARAEQIVRGGRAAKAFSDEADELRTMLRRMVSDFAKAQQYGQFQTCFDMCSAESKDEFLQLLEIIHSESEGLIEYSKRGRFAVGRTNL